MVHRLSDLPAVLPLFPLPGALLLPRASLPLHLFEPRYLAMLDDVLKVPDRMIGLIQPLAPDGDGALQAVGCAGRVTQFAETPDRRYLITLSGVSRFRLAGEQDGFAPYRRGRVTWTGFARDLGGAEEDDGFDRSGFMALLRRYFDGRSLNADWEAMQKAEDEMLINSLSMLLDFAPEEKQALLEAPSLKARRETLMALLEYVLRGGGREETLQ